MIDNLLPIGTIVEVKDNKKKIMIIGVKQRAVNGEGDVFDYSGVPYPEGHLGIDLQVLFNHDDIENIFFRGFENQERNYFLNELKKVYEPENAFDIPAEPLIEEVDAERLGAGDLNF